MHPAPTPRRRRQPRAPLAGTECAAEVYRMCQEIVGDAEPIRGGGSDDAR